MGRGRTKVVASERCKRGIFSAWAVRPRKGRGNNHLSATGAESRERGRSGIVNVAFSALMAFCVPVFLGLTAQAENIPRRWR